MAAKPIINPKILQWAREKAGYSLEEAVAYAKINSPRKCKGEPQLTPAQRLQEWESGRENPSINQLEQLAKTYRRPLITFFLPSPPVQENTLIDFRTMPGTNGKGSPEFEALKRRVLLIQNELKEIVSREGDEEIKLVGSISTDMEIFEAAEIIRKKLNMPTRDRYKKESEYFKAIREHIHHLGIYVLLMGDVGDYHSKILPEEFRGLALADKFIPMIVVNKYDAKAANVFTLLHELVHIFLGNSGITNNPVFENISNSKIEKFCNAVAAEILVPSIQIQELYSSSKYDFDKTIEELAKYFKVSQAVIAKRLYDLKIISFSDYYQCYKNFVTLWEKLKLRQKESKGGPTYKDQLRNRFGSKLIKKFKYASENDLLSFTEVARILDITLGSLTNIFI